MYAPGSKLAHSLWSPLEMLPSDHIFEVAPVTEVLYTAFSWVELFPLKCGDEVKCSEPYTGLNDLW